MTSTTTPRSRIVGLLVLGLALSVSQPSTAQDPLDPNSGMGQDIVDAMDEFKQLFGVSYPQTGSSGGQLTVNGQKIFSYDPQKLGEGSDGLYGFEYMTHAFLNEDIFKDKDPEEIANILKLWETLFHEWLHAEIGEYHIAQCMAQPTPAQQLDCLMKLDEFEKCMFDNNTADPQQNPCEHAYVHIEVALEFCALIETEKAKPEPNEDVLAELCEIFLENRDRAASNLETCQDLIGPGGACEAEAAAAFPGVGGYPTPAPLDIIDQTTEAPECQDDQGNDCCPEPEPEPDPDPDPDPDQGGGGGN